MGTEAIWVAVIGAAVSAVGAGIQYSQAQSAAADNATLAAMNAQGAAQAAQQQGDLAQMQASINQELAARDEDAAAQNAIQLEAQAKTGTAVTQQNIGKTREDFARMIAAQRVQAAKAGVVDTTGSPLELLAKTAATEQQNVDQQRYEDENNRRGLFAAAEEQRAQGRLARIQGMSYASQGAGAKALSLAQIAQSKIDMYAARAQSAAMRNNATAGLITSAGGIASGLYQSYRATPRSTAPQNQYVIT